MIPHMIRQGGGSIVNNSSTAGYGPGVIWRIDVADRGVIDAADLEPATPRMQEGDIVLLDTGRARHIDTDKYTDHASLTAEAAEWLVRRGAEIVGVDFATPDLAVKLRPPDFAFPLSQGVLMAEHVTNLGSLAGQRAEIMFLGLNVAGSDGAQGRVIARPLG
jgi:arylformamidase